MEPKIVEKGALRLVGLLKSGHPQDLVPQIPEIWDAFMQLEAQVSPHSVDKAYYGAWFGGPTENVAYLVGMAVEGLSAVPEGLVERTAPAARYAEFACTVSTFGPTSDFAFTQWLPASAYDYDMAAAEIEYYPPTTENDDSPTTLSIPIKLKEPQPTRLREFTSQ